MDKTGGQKKIWGKNRIVMDKTGGQKKIWGKNSSVVAYSNNLSTTQQTGASAPSTNHKSRSFQSAVFGPRSSPSIRPVSRDRQSKVRPKFSSGISIARPSSLTVGKSCVNCTFILLFIAGFISGILSLAPFAPVPSVRENSAMLPAKGNGSAAASWAAASRNPERCAPVAEFGAGGNVLRECGATGLHIAIASSGVSLRFSSKLGASGGLVMRL
mmetsp:Transcript_18551/g.27997  ORF Transcript_18551/g.27997 Transcript_18551/m.27997 type:complete len:214 (-) Transcript_18551:902-1543(-)